MSMPTGGPFDQNPYGQNPQGQNPYGQNPYGQPPAGQNPYQQNPYGPAAGQNPYATNPYDSPLAASGGGAQGSSSNNSKAIASLVLGLIGMLAWLCPLLGLAVTIPGLALGIMGLKSQQRGLAIGGIVASSIFLLLSLANAVLGAILAASGNHPMFK